MSNEQDEIQDTITAISAIAPIVAANAATLKDAIAEEQAAEAALLDRMVAAVGPGALAAIASRPVIRETVRWHANNTYTSSSETRADWRGVRMEGKAIPEEDHPRANDGGYEGDSLWLLPDGSWRRLRYSGSWSRWQGATSQWEAKVEALTTAQVAEVYELEPLVERLHAALDAAAKGATPARAAQAKARAAKLAALLALLG